MNDFQQEEGMMSRATLLHRRGMFKPFPEIRRQTAIDMVNRIILENQDPKASLDQAAAAEQQILDDHM